MTGEPAVTAAGAGCEAGRRRGLARRCASSPRGRRPRRAHARLEALAARAYGYRDGDGLPLPLRRSAEALRDRLSSRPPLARPSYYDLLASEARLASFIAVAKDDVPVEHWFRLGRTLTHAAGETALVSWSGSMFEYLMPALVMRTFPCTLLDADLQRRGAAADRVRRRARRALGRERERLQPARPRTTPISIAPSACPTSRSSAGSAATW